MMDSPALLPTRTLWLILRDRLTEADLVAGSTDVPILASGRQAYERLRRALPAPAPSGVLYQVSPVRRAQQTAARVQADFAWSPQEALRPRDCGSWEGLRWEEIRARDPRRCERFWNEPMSASAPGGETLAAVSERVVDWLISLANRDDWQHAVVVTHPTIVRLLLCHVLEIPPRHLLRIHLEPLTMTRLSHSWLGWQLDGVNLNG